jgi:hypothetical protein
MGLKRKRFMTESPNSLDPYLAYIKICEKQFKKPPPFSYISMGQIIHILQGKIVLQMTCATEDAFSEAAVESGQFISIALFGKADLLFCFLHENDKNQVVT